MHIWLTHNEGKYSCISVFIYYGNVDECLEIKMENKLFWDRSDQISECNMHTHTQKKVQEQQMAVWGAGRIDCRTGNILMAWLLLFFPSTKNLKRKLIFKNALRQNWLLE
jgi:hypothetical protein